ncbi:lactosylceramide 4-alpha-galactosyltransferase-like [Drosophila nasuta]|uniref:lactosylceramide 4-alpha-galactosyltransferase-like n=1 Tax=Drosophila nasuta TaxID=42062 RepID=UPI00295F3EDA|nr:lactosylceramide 4-alpha-galactosyltransferase-like [Drosophila nasuta]
MLQCQRSIRAFLLNSGKILLLPVLLINVFIIVFMLIRIEKSIVHVKNCYKEAVTNGLSSVNWTSIDGAGPSPLENVLFAEKKPRPGRTIFFLETNCVCADPQYNLLALRSRQACTIESAALHYPDLDVFVLSVCSSYRKPSDPIINTLLSYTNVHIRRVNLWQFSAETPVENWIRRENLFDSRYLMNNISNLLRLLVLYRYGGLYLDMDMLVLRRFENESINFLGAEPNFSVGNSVIGLKPYGFGRKLAELFLLDFQRNYNGNIWAQNGPRSVSRVMSYVCNTNNITVMQQDLLRCQGIKIFPVKDFYEIAGHELQYFFDPKFANATMKRLQNSYLTHIWNHQSSMKPLKVDSEAGYIQLAAQHCPAVLKVTEKWFN